MLTLETEIFVEGITGSEILDFLLTCTDEEYQRWWPGTHLEFHTVRRGTGPHHRGDIVLMDEYIGARRVRLTGVVDRVVPGRAVVIRLRKVIPLPARLSIEFQDRDGGVALRHTISAGLGGVGRILDPLVRIFFFSPAFARAMDQHVRTEFPLLRDRLVEKRTGS